MLLLVVVLLAIAWTTGVLAMRPFFYADYALVVRDNLQAIQWAERARRLNGDPARVEFINARVQRRLNDFAAMERHLLAAQRLGLPQPQMEKERALALAQSGRMHEVLDALTEYVRDPGEDVADIADAYSLGLEAAGRSHEAQVVLTVWIADCPADPKPHVQLGRLAETERRDEDAEAEYRLALQKNDDYPMALYALSRLLLERKRPEEAIALLNKCVQVDAQTKPAVDIVMAGCLRLLGERETARNLLAQVLELPQSEVDRAYRRLARLPEAGAAAFERGKLELDDRQFESAVKYFRLAIQQAPNHFDADYQLGLALKRLGRDQEAEQAFERVAKTREELAEIDPFVTRLAVNPHDFEARYQMGLIMLENGRAERGLFYLHGVLADAPEHLPTHRRLAEFFTANRQSQPDYAERAKQHQKIVDEIERKAE